MRDLRVIGCAGLVALALLGCGSADDAGGSGGGGAETISSTSSTTTTLTVTSGLGFEAFEPTPGATVRMNQRIAVRFEPGADADIVDPTTVALDVNGMPTRIWPYGHPTASGREFRHVPLPAWTPGETYSVTIAAGAAYAGDPSLRLEQDFTWSFTVEPTPWLEQFEEGLTASPTPEELDIMAGTGAYADADLVRDWEEPTSSLYVPSIAVQPDLPEVVAFAARMLESLDPLQGVGLAAPQLGVNRRLFVADVNGERRAFVNPRLETVSTELYYGFPEGCLSIPDVSSLVGRPAVISAEFDTPEGDHVTGYVLEDFDAKVFLHEYDHLNGILQTDRAELGS